MNMILDFVNDVNTEIYHKTILIKAAALVDFFRKIRYSRIEITLKGGFTNDEKKFYDNTHLQQSDCILSRITTALSCTLTGAQPAGRAGITIRKNAESRGGNRHSETKRFSNPFRKGYHGAGRMCRLPRAGLYRRSGRISRNAGRDLCTGSDSQLSQPRDLYRITECSDEASRPCGMYRTL